MLCDGNYSTVFVNSKEAITTFPPCSWSQLLELFRPRTMILPSFPSWVLLKVRSFFIICIHIEMKHVKTRTFPAFRSVFTFHSTSRVVCQGNHRQTTCSRLTMNIFFFCRILPTTIRALSRLDMFRCSFLYSEHHALVHNLHRPLLVASLPDAIRPKQDSEAGGAENFLRVAAVDSHESATELNVF